MNSADFANKQAQQQERHKRRPGESVRAGEDGKGPESHGHHGNGRHRTPPAAPDHGAEAPDDEDPFADEEGHRSGEFEEGSFEEATTARPTAEHRPPQRVASHDEFGDITFSTPGTAEGDTEVEEEPLTAEEIQRETERWAPKTARDAVIDTGIEKTCRVCGKDLRGHRRYKDDKGYICRDCDREERARRIPCAECGKPVPPEALRPWGPIAICVRCWADHESDPKMRIKRKVSSRPWEELEKKSVLAIAAIALAALLVLFMMQLIWG